MTIELIKDFASPCVALILGLVLLRKVEIIKTQVNRNSQFSIKWAESFYSYAQEYMESIGRYLALLSHLQMLKPEDKEKEQEIIHELNEFHVAIPEIQLRIRVFATFSPIHGAALIKASNSIQEKISKLMRDKKGNLDIIINDLKEFCIVAKSAHAEMLQISETARLPKNG